MNNPFPLVHNQISLARISATFLGFPIGDSTWYQVPESDKKPNTKQWVYHRLNVLLCFYLIVAACKNKYFVFFLYQPMSVRVHASDYPPVGMSKI